MAANSGDARAGLLGAVEPTAALAFGREALKSLDGERTEKDFNHDATAAQ